MRKTILRNLVAYSGLAIVLLQSCKDDSKLRESLPTPDQSFYESFDNYQTAYANGWRSINKSTPVGRIWYDATETPDFGTPNYLVKYFPGWEQAQLTLDPAQFPNADFPGRIWSDAYLSHAGSNGYAATSIACAELLTRDASSLSLTRFDISTWLVSPEKLIKNGDKIVFYAYSKGLSRLQLWVNPTNSLNVGTDATNTGDFNLKLLDINPGYAKVETNPAGAFPTEWTRFEGEVRGLQAPVQGRFGFRYFLQNQPALKTSTVDPSDFDTLYTQIHHSVIGLDEVSFESAQ